MFRWLKDRKKTKKGEQGKDEYGFKGKSGDYGFDDKVYHIYEEIPDLPDCAESPGPYMVVPLDIGDKKLKGKKVSFQGILEVSNDSGIEQKIVKSLDLVNSVDSNVNSNINRRIPVMGIGQKTSQRGGEFTCALVGSKISSESNLNTKKSKDKIYRGPALPARNYIKKSMSAKSMENVADTKTRSRQLLENILSDLSKSSDDIFGEKDSSKAKLSDSSSNSVDALSDKRVNNLSMDSNDTGCEYDMSTSGDSDKSSQDSYEYYLHQVEQNFILRCRVQELSQDRESSIRRESNADDDSDSDSLTTISTDSQVTVHHGQTRQSPCSSDEGTMADLSESENSSGYYDSFAVSKKDNTAKPVIKLTSAILQNSSTQRNRSSRHKLHSSKDRKSAIAQPKPKPKTNILEDICERYDCVSESSSSEHSSKRSVSDVYSRRSNSEVYSPPPSRAFHHTQSFRKPSVSSVRSSGDGSQIYQSGGSAKNNRLLSDLIMMNYNRQGHQF